MEDLVNQVTARVMAALENPGQQKSCSAEPPCRSGYRHGVGVGVSNRHIHLCAEDLKSLFGSAYKLEKEKELSQPGEFASTAFVDIEKNGRRLEKLRVLGPIRSKTQIELSATDARGLKMQLPVRNSGDISGTPGISIIGPNGRVELAEGCIIASRHLHLTNADAERLGVVANQQVSVRLLGEKSGIIDNVFCRISDNYSFELHIDTDDANAFLQKTGNIAEIII